MRVCRGAWGAPLQGKGREGGSLPLPPHTYMEQVSPTVADVQMSFHVMIPFKERTSLSEETWHPELWGTVFVGKCTQFWVLPSMDRLTLGSLSLQQWPQNPLPDFNTRGTHLELEKAVGPRGLSIGTRDTSPQLLNSYYVPGPLKGVF